MPSNNLLAIYTSKITNELKFKLLKSLNTKYVTQFCTRLQNAWGFAVVPYCGINILPKYWKIPNFIAESRYFILEMYKTLFIIIFMYNLEL